MTRESGRRRQTKQRRRRRNLSSYESEQLLFPAQFVSPWFHLTSFVWVAKALWHIASSADWLGRGKDRQNVKEREKPQFVWLWVMAIPNTVVISCAMHYFSEMKKKSNSNWKKISSDLLWSESKKSFWTGEACMQYFLSHTFMTLLSKDAIHNTKHPQARAGQDGKMANVCVMHRRHITPGLQGSRAAGGR